MWGQEELAALGPRESQTNAEYLLEEASGQKRWQLALRPEERPRAALVETYRRWIANRRERIPSAYVTGKAFFRDECLEVGPACLVPRPETELLVEAVIRQAGFAQDAEFSFLDLGTGSGAVAISLLRHFKKARAVMADVSSDALAVAGRNAERYALTGRVELRLSDFFEAFRGPVRPQWSLMVSNPPYLAQSDWDQVEPELLYEPRQALDGGLDGLSAYRQIAGEAANFLHPGGGLFFEVGQGQAPAVQTLLGENGFKNICILKDWSGIDRIVSSTRCL